MIESECSHYCVLASVIKSRMELNGSRNDSWYPCGFFPHYEFAGHLIKYYCLSQAKDCSVCNTVLIDVHHHSM